MIVCFFCQYGSSSETADCATVYAEVRDGQMVRRVSTLRGWLTAKRSVRCGYGYADCDRMIADLEQGIVPSRAEWEAQRAAQ